jgi:Uma2 family endonuclease
MAIYKKMLTVEEFEAFTALPENRDRNFELIHGEIVEKTPTELHGLITSRIIIAFGLYLRDHPGGRVVNEVRHRIPGDQHNARQPDISYFSDARRPVLEKGAAPVMPDLAVEVQSPDDNLKDMREKAAYYLANGTRMVWLVYPQKRLVEVFRPDDVQLLDIEDTLEGADVLPGFALHVRDIFAE